MAAAYKVLGQVAPSATANTDLYTVPAATQTASSTVSICNRGSTQTTFRIAVRVGGAPIDVKQYIAYDAPVDPNDTKFVTVGMTLAATDVVTVYAGNTNLSFNLFGAENP